MELTISGYNVHIDDIHYDVMTKFPWYVSTTSDGHKYVKAIVKRKSVFLHRILLFSSDKYIIDHENGNTLDNRLSNLRIVTATQNNANQVRKNKHGFMGVYKFKNRAKPYYASIQKNGVKINGGKYYKTAEEAFQRYKELHLEHFGEYSKFNRSEK